MARTLFALLFLLGFPLGAFSETAVLIPLKPPAEDCGKDTPGGHFFKISKELNAVACKKDYAEKKCDDFKNSLDPADRDKVVNCGDPTQVEGSLGSYMIGCSSGVLGFVVDSVKDIIEIPGMVVDMVAKNHEAWQACRREPLVKATWLSPVAMLMSEQERKSALALSCEDLQKKVDDLTRSTLKTVRRKQIYQQDHSSFLQQGATAEQAEGLYPASMRALSPAEESFMALREISNPTTLKDLYDQLKTEFACFHPQARAELMCKLVAEGAGLVGTGGLSAALKSPKAILALEKIAAKIPGLHKASELANGWAKALPKDGKKVFEVGIDGEQVPITIDGSDIQHAADRHEWAENHPGKTPDVYKHELSDLVQDLGANKKSLTEAAEKRSALVQAIKDAKNSGASSEEISELSTQLRAAQENVAKLKSLDDEMSERLRQLAGNKITTYLPPGTEIEDIIETLPGAQLTSRTVASGNIEPNSATAILTYKNTNGEYRYVVHYCQKPEGCLRDGKTIPKGHITTIYPECGPDLIKTSMSYAQIMDALGNGRTPTQDQLVGAALCSKN
ncbi:MAG: hypothetical protein KF789_04750 [Bdellovibrionaceae bacterium]|nr:hypothetical protein [Pseudobdellovibrionaceae bacterium]